MSPSCLGDLLPRLKRSGKEGVSPGVILQLFLVQPGEAGRDNALQGSPRMQKLLLTPLERLGNTTGTQRERGGSGWVGEAAGPRMSTA